VTASCQLVGLRGGQWRTGGTIKTTVLVLPQEPSEQIPRSRSPKIDNWVSAPPMADGNPPTLPASGVADPGCSAAGTESDPMGPVGSMATTCSTSSERASSSSRNRPTARNSYQDGGVSIGNESMVAFFKENFEFIFEAGGTEPGFELDMNDLGRVKEVAPDGQAGRLGVEIGMRVTLINGKEYVEGLLEECVKAEQSYNVTLRLDRGKMLFRDAVLLAILVFALAAGIAVLFSGVLEVGPHTYQLLVALERIWMAPIGLGFMLAFFFHAVDGYKCPLWAKAIFGLLVVYLIAAGVASHTKSYPAGGLIVAFAHFPAILAGMRIKTKQKTSARWFFFYASAIIEGVAIVVLVVWIAWIFAADMPWGEDTKAILRADLSNVFGEYGIDWQQCLAERGKGSGTDDAVILNCQRVELIAYLIWVIPLVEFGVLTTIAIFCYLRHRTMVPGSNTVDRTIRQLVYFVCFFFAAGWVVCSTAGASMGLSALFMQGLACTGFTVVLWVVFAIDLTKMGQQFKSSVIGKIAGPFFEGDHFAAMVFCCTEFLIIGFLCMEFMIRQFEKCCRKEGHSWLTTRGLKFSDILSNKHWASVLTKAFNWSLLYLVFFLCARFTPVFLAWLGQVIAKMDFGLVVGAFYITGLIMFLLPPVPGVPVYVASGTILVVRGQEEPWLNFWTACLFCMALSLCLKLNAVAMQQKIIGELLGKSESIQQLVGVHTPTIKAIEMILKKKGLSIEKVSILCGGPDWPTSVLTGILSLDLKQMLLGTMPCLFLIVPCVLAGASLYHEDLKSHSAMIIMMVGISQGMCLLSALVFIARVTEKHHDDLNEPRKEHKALILKSKEAKKEFERWMERTQWSRMTAPEKFCLVVGVTVEIGSCWVCFLMGSSCFRKFETGRSIDDPYSEGGLAPDRDTKGSVANMIMPLGEKVIIVMIVGVFFIWIFGRLNMMRASKILPEGITKENSKGRDVTESEDGYFCGDPFKDVDTDGVCRAEKPCASCEEYRNRMVKALSITKDLSQHTVNDEPTIVVADSQPDDEKA